MSYPSHDQNCERKKINEQTKSVGRCLWHFQHKQATSSHGRLHWSVVCLCAGETINYNTNKITHSQPVLWIDNLLDSLEISSEESFWPIIWQVLTTKPEQLTDI